MGILLLAQGDPEAKQMLRTAIEVRYGPSPPVLESLRMTFTGRARAKVGPVKTWVPVDVNTWFQFPNRFRVDFTVRPLGLPIHRAVNAFDSSTYREMRSGDKPVVVDDEAQVHSVRRRLWAIAALLLTPLGEHFVNLTAEGDTCFKATNTELDDAVTVYLSEDKAVDHIEVECLNPDTGTEQLHRLCLSEERVAINDLILPQTISAFWDDEPFYEITPSEAISNPELEDSPFTLEDFA